jgi:hypothetical protein
MREKGEELNRCTGKIKEDDAMGTAVGRGSDRVVN